MDTNYRNTAEIVQFARSLVAGDDFADIEGSVQVGDGIQEVVRHGREPIVEHFTSWGAHDAALLARARQATEAVGASHGDLAILCRSSREVERTMRQLTGEGIPAIDLEKYTGAPVDAVKVGTIKRSKGLEFKKVMLPRVRASDLVHPANAAGGDAGDRERAERDRREIYVAITRARDAVWVGVSI
jgi:superfamily I DNA/RNA helicase